jgi:hypothetical protein
MIIGIIINSWNMKNDWEKKETCSAYLSVSSKIFATSAWVWTRSTSFSSFQRRIHLIPYIYPAFVPFGRYCTSIPLYIWIRQSPLSSTCWHILFHMLFIVSKQCACSRRVHIEGHMNRVGLNCMLVILNNNSDNDRFGFFLSKKNTNRIFCSITV